MIHVPELGIGLLPALALALFQEAAAPRLEPGKPIASEITGAAPVVHTPAIAATYKDAAVVGVEFGIRVDSPGVYHIDLRSYAFDAYLVLRDDSGAALAEDDDGLLGTHARVIATLESGHEYRVTACALHGARGGFEVSLTAGAPPPMSAEQRRAADEEDDGRRLAWYESRYGPGSIELATAVNLVGLSRYHARRHAEAEDLFRRALAIREKALGPDHPEVAESLNNLGVLLKSQGRSADAEPLYRRSLAIREKALGHNHPEVAASLYNLAGLLSDQSRLADAEPLYRRSLAIREKTLGPDHALVAASLNSLAILLTDQGRFADAEPLARRSLAIREKALGPDHPDGARSLNTLAAILNRQGLYADAEPFYRRSLAIYEKALGPDHPQVALSLNNLAEGLRAQGRFADAEPFFRRSLAIWEKALGPDHPDVALSLNNLATLWRDQGRFADAEPLYRRSLAIREKAQGPDHRDVAAGLNNLSLLLRDQGRYADAEPLHRRSLAILEKALGPDHPDVALSLNNLATLLTDQGRSADAEPFYRRSLAIWEKALGPDHPSVALSLNNLAALLSGQGRSADAEPFYRRSLAIWEKALGPDHPSVALCLNNLAMLLRDQGRFADAELLLRRALAIYEKALGRDHPEVARSLNNLSALSRDRGRHAEVETLLRSALAIYEHALGPDHPMVATCLNNLASQLADHGRYADAEPLFRRSLAIREKALGPDHCDVARSLNNLAWLLRDQRREPEARTLYSQALRITLDHLERELPVMSEADRFRFLALIEGPERFLACAGSADERGLAEVLDLSVAWKGQITRLQAASLALSRRADDPAIRSRIGRIQALQKSLSEIVLLPQGKRAPDHDDRVKAMRDERLALERDLNRELKIDEVLATPTGSDVRAALSADSALVDFHVGKLVFAWVMRPLAEPRLVALGDVSPIRNAVSAYLRSSLVSRGAAPVETGPDPAAELRRLLWEPLRAAIGDAKTVFVSPDGFLCELPFGVIPEADGSFLIEQHRFVYLSDATRLLASDPATAEREGPTLAVGDVNYFRADADAAALVALGPTTRSRLGGSSWAPLSATREEVQFLRGLHDQALEWKAPFTEITGKAATEDAVARALPGKRYIHLATHGYFEPDDMPSLVANAAKAGADTLSLDEDRKATGLLPGLLTGLVFAGVNARPEQRQDDGYLTAEEIQYLDLSACDVAVLSACETALGSERAGNGLMSLRRAFEVAGAKTVVSSLWKVDDRSAAELTKTFYENYWLKGLGKAEALHQAQLALLSRNRAEFGGDARPSTWGAFVLSGDYE